MWHNSWKEQRLCHGERDIRERLSLASFLKPYVFPAFIKTSWHRIEVGDIVVSMTTPDDPIPFVFDQLHAIPIGESILARYKELGGRFSFPDGFLLGEAIFYFENDIEHKGAHIDNRKNPKTTLAARLRYLRNLLPAFSRTGGILPLGDGNQGLRFNQPSHSTCPS